MPIGNVRRGASDVLPAGGVTALKDLLDLSNVENFSKASIISGLAPVNNPTFTGTVTMPVGAILTGATTATSDDSGKVASTAFVQDVVAEAVVSVGGAKTRNAYGGAPKGVPEAILVTGITSPVSSDPLFLTRVEDQNGKAAYASGLDWFLEYDLANDQWTLYNSSSPIYVAVSDDTPLDVSESEGWSVTSGEGIPVIEALPETLVVTGITLPEGFSSVRVYFSEYLNDRPKWKSLDDVWLVQYSADESAWQIIKNDDSGYASQNVSDAPTPVGLTLWDILLGEGDTVVAAVYSYVPDFIGQMCRVGPYPLLYGRTQAYDWYIAETLDPVSWRFMNIS
jgi:hypothetical protein